MTGAAPVPLPTPAVTAAPVPQSSNVQSSVPSTHTTMDPYSLPQATGVYAQKNRRVMAPPPLSMPEGGQMQHVPSPMMAPQPSPQMPHHHMGMHAEYAGYHHPSAMVMPQHAQPMHPYSPHGVPVRSVAYPQVQVGTPMTPVTPMVMTPMSGPHQTGFEGYAVAPQQSYQMSMGPMTPMTPMTPSMSFLSDSSAHTMQPVHSTGMVHPNVQGPLLPMQYGVPQQSVYDMHAAHSPMSPTLSNQSSPTYAQAYMPATHEMGYQMQPQMQPQMQHPVYQTAPQVGYSYEGYSMEGVMPKTDGEMWDEASDLNNRRPLRRNRQKDSNQAVDAMRYKTKMCRNWELTNRCPYGPRCLFAHGRCELRSTQVNTEAITAAALSADPHRAFYENGRFPDFVPVPVELMAQIANGNIPSNETTMATMTA